LILAQLAYLQDCAVFRLSSPPATVKPKKAGIRTVASTRRRLRQRVKGRFLDSYDLDGWRIWKEENGKTTVYVRYNDQVIYQETFNGMSVDRYTTPESKRAFVYLGDELVGTVINGTEARYYVNDHLGTTELVTDANGNIISRIEHTPFGEAVQVQSGTVTGDGSEDYFFTGKEKDATGLYYFGGRYYDPEIGQFISEDPGQDGVNWYSYCRNNPVSYFDPDGWYTSPWYLRSTVPGQTSWDNALTAWENRRYGEAVAWTGMMLGEQFMFVWTLGESQAALRTGAIGTKVVGSTVAKRTVTGNNVVYISKNAAGEVQYVGITNDIARRAAEHLIKKGIRIRELMGNLSRYDARAIEQALIEIHGLSKSGGTLINKINSIAKINPIYAKALQRGYDLLKSIGYK
jgi:RHS repeat-associated protein